MDIVKRLRDYADGLSGYAADMMNEAANEIERSREEVKHLQNMLAIVNLHKNAGYEVKTIGFDDALKEGE